jgi:hypothetical protein
MDKSFNVFNYVSTFYISLSDVKIFPEDYLKNIFSSITIKMQRYTIYLFL